MTPCPILAQQVSTTVVRMARFMPGMSMRQVMDVFGLTASAQAAWSTGRYVTAFPATQAVMVRFAQFAASAAGCRRLWRIHAAALRLPPARRVLTGMEGLFSSTPPPPDNTWHLMWERFKVIKPRGANRAKRPYRAPDLAADAAAWALLLPLWPDPAAARARLVYADGTKASEYEPAE